MGLNALCHFPSSDFIDINISTINYTVNPSAVGINNRHIASKILEEYHGPFFAMVKIVTASLFFVSLAEFSRKVHPLYSKEFVTRERGGEKAVIM